MLNLPSDGALSDHAEHIVLFYVNNVPSSTIGAPLIEVLTKRYNTLTVNHLPS